MAQIRDEIAGITGKKQDGKKKKEEDRGRRETGKRADDEGKGREDVI